jgi:hypothetical protein
MKKQFAVVGVTLILLTIALSGCQGERTKGTEDFAETLSPITENSVRTNLSNINANIYNFDANYRWSYIMNLNLTFFTESLITDMQNYETRIKDARLAVENSSLEYYTAKAKADIHQLTPEETSTMNDIETMLSDFQVDKEKVTTVVSSMATYREFIDAARLTLILGGNYTATVTLMNSKFLAQQYEEALVYAGELTQLCQDMKNLSQQKMDLGIATYSQDVLTSWDVMKEAWELYEQYLTLLLQDENGSSAYIEYSQKIGRAHV